MKIAKKISKKAVVTAAINVILTANFAGFMIYGNYSANLLHSQYAAERWMNYDDKLQYAQISCFTGNGSQLSTQTIGSVRAAVKNALSDAAIKPKEDERLWYDAYSSHYGETDAGTDDVSKVKCDVRAVSSDFFLLRDFDIESGSSFSDSDIMQNKAVIDSNLSWELFGSADAAGMEFTLGNKELTVAAVIDMPDSKTENELCGKIPRVYIPYYVASMLKGESYTAVDCYEVVMPDPVKKFAYKAIKKSTDDFGENTSIVQNTGRFSPYELLKDFGKLKNLVVSDKQIAYPWWENAARITQFKLSFIYVTAALIIVFPLVTIVKVIFRLIKRLKQVKKFILNVAESLFEKVRTHEFKRRNDNAKK